MADISNAILNGLDTVRAQTGKYNDKMSNQLFDIIGDRSSRMLKALAG
jgi:hypothetical protein